jgi:proteasome lid subunit RPN8/RPN11
MLAQAVAELPNECCGLLAGKIGGGCGVAGGGNYASHSPPTIHHPPLATRVVSKRYPLVNAAASATEYLAEPRSLFAAHKDMRSLGLDILAIYHSHPTSPPLPSRTDRERAFYPDVIYLIISLQTDPPVLRGWWLPAGEESREAEWAILEEA